MSISSSGYSFISKTFVSPPTCLSGIQIAFVGESVDERGEATTRVLLDVAVPICPVRFDASDHNIYLDNSISNHDRLISRIRGKTRILLDATTLGLGEILHILMAAKQCGCLVIEILYAEPGKYTQDIPNGTDDPQRRDFKLTKNCRFRAIHGFAHEYESNSKAAHIYFLGFEPGRLRNAFEQREDIDTDSYNIHYIIGVPAFQAGWESNTISPHLQILVDDDITEQAITYCQANSIRESYLTLWELYKQLGDTRWCFYVSPLGTKPHAVGAALFLMETKGNAAPTSLFYDHPERVSNRSKSVATWHHVIVKIA